jgi:hypothetical protein
MEPRNPSNFVATRPILGYFKTETPPLQLYLNDRICLHRHGCTLLLNTRAFSVSSRIALQSNRLAWQQAGQRLPLFQFAVSRVLRIYSPHLKVLDALSFCHRDVLHLTAMLVIARQSSAVKLETPHSECFPSARLQCTNYNIVLIIISTQFIL